MSADRPSVIDAAVWESLQALEAAGEPGFLAELVREFLSQAPSRIAALRAAAARGDAQALEFEAHRLKGSCGSLGAFAMADSCDGLETLGREGSCLGHAELLAGLEQHWQAVRVELESAIAHPDG